MGVEGGMKEQTEAKAYRMKQVKRGDKESKTEYFQIKQKSIIPIPYLNISLYPSIFFFFTSLSVSVCVDMSLKSVCIVYTCVYSGVLAHECTSRSEENIKYVVLQLSARIFETGPSMISSHTGGQRVSKVLLSQVLR